MALEGLAVVCGRIKWEKRVRASGRERESERQTDRQHRERDKAEAGEAACAYIGMALALF